MISNWRSTCPTENAKVCQVCASRSRASIDLLTRDHHGRETKKIIHARTRVRVSRPVHKETTLEYMEREKEGIIIKRKRALVH